MTYQPDDIDRIISNYRMPSQEWVNKNYTNLAAIMEIATAEREMAEAIKKTNASKQSKEPSRLTASEEILDAARKSLASVYEHHHIAPDAESALKMSRRAQNFIARCLSESPAFKQR